MDSIEEPYRQRGLRAYAPFIGLFVLMMSLIRIDNKPATSADIEIQDRYEMICQGLSAAIFFLFVRKDDLWSHFRLRGPLTWLVIFGAYMSLSALWSNMPKQAALKGVQFMLVSSLAYFYGLALGDRRRLVLFLAGSFLAMMLAGTLAQVATGGLRSLVRVYETAGGNFDVDRQRLSILSIHPLTLANVTGCLILMLVCLPGGKSPLAWMALLAFFGAHILAWGRFAIGSLIFCWLLYHLVRTRERPLTSMIRGLFAVLLVFALLFTTRLTDLGVRGAARFFGSEVSMKNADFTLNGRVPLWGYATDILADSSLTQQMFGYGFASFRTFGKMKFNYGGEAHNAYLQVLFELGIVGLILFVVLLVKLIRQTQSRGRSLRQRTEAMIPVIFLLMCGLYDSALSFSRSFELLFLIAYCCTPLIVYGEPEELET